MFLADDLEWAYIIKRGTKKKYDVILDSYAGLSLTNYKVFPHYNKISEELKKKANDYENNHNMKFYYLDDGEFILDYYK
jgi:peptidase E